MAAHLVMAVYVCWFVSVFLEEVLLCRPLAFNWDPNIEGGRCANRPAAYLAAGIINLLTDVMVLCLPVPMVELTITETEEVCPEYCIRGGICVRLQSQLDFAELD